MVIHLPWDPRLGGARPQIELAHRFRLDGHHVDVFSLTDAFRASPRTRVGALMRRPFRAIASRHVAAVADGYDVIDVNQGDVVPRPLRFPGVLVVRSNGLIPVYRAFAREAAKRWPPARRPSYLARPVRALQERLEAVAVRRSFLEADAVIVPNEWERDYLQDWVGVGAKTRVVRHGLGEDYFAACEGNPAQDRRRHASKEVVCIATWQDRKGRQDWPTIMEGLHAADPHIHVRLLGTGAPEDEILGELPLAMRRNVTVVQDYAPDHLAELLSRATVGAFPSYLEAFGLGALEQLAAGVPTVAYHIPGPVDILQGSRAGALVEPGDTTAVLHKLLEWLRLPEDDYCKLAAEARAHARAFTWTSAAELTMAAYDSALRRVNPSPGPSTE